MNILLGSIEAKSEDHAVPERRVGALAGGLAVTVCVRLLARPGWSVLSCQAEDETRCWSQKDHYWLSWSQMNVELERVEVLELLGMTLAHLNVVESRAEMSPRVPLLMAIRDKLAHALQEDI